MFDRKPNLKKANINIDYGNIKLKILIQIQLVLQMLINNCIYQSNCLYKQWNRLHCWIISMSPFCFIRLRGCRSCCWCNVLLRIIMCLADQSYFVIFKSSYTSWLFVSPNLETRFFVLVYQIPMLSTLLLVYVLLRFLIFKTAKCIKLNFLLDNMYFCVHLKPRV